VVTVFLLLSCTLLTVLLFSFLPALVNCEFFLIPVLYAAYFSARRGLAVAGISGILYLATGYLYRSPDPAALAGIASGVVLFLLIAVLLTWLVGRIRDADARYRSIISRSPLGLVGVTLPDFAIQRANGTFAGMLCYRTDELARMPFASLLVEPLEPARFFALMRQLAPGEFFETCLRTREGTGCRVRLSWTLLDERTACITAVTTGAPGPAGGTGSDRTGMYLQPAGPSPAARVVLQDGRIRFASPAFGMFLGYPPQELAGKDPLELLDPRDHETFETFMAYQKSGLLPAEGTGIRFVTKSGSLKEAVCLAGPVMHDNRPATLLYLFDLSPRQRFEERIRQDNERRWGIIVTIAHELRTPLQPILGYLSLLIQDPEGFGIGDDVKMMLGRCLASVERERQIINHLLELSVLDREKIRLMPEQFLLSGLVQSVLDTSGYLATGTVTLDIPEDLVITADRDRLYSVLDSLLSNAVTYSAPPRTITISYRPGAGGATHTISVQDNGIGIAADKHASIFEPFQLADAASLSRKYNRLGLSLSIARKIIRMHGGDITVESAVAAGSTFTLHIPRELPEEVLHGA
jgi:PAS domain S-box-containing protein